MECVPVSEPDVSLQACTTVQQEAAERLGEQQFLELSGALNLTMWYQNVEFLKIIYLHVFLTDTYIFRYIFYGDCTCKWIKRQQGYSPFWQNKMAEISKTADILNPYVSASHSASSWSLLERHQGEGERLSPCSWVEEHVFELSSEHCGFLPHQQKGHGSCKLLKMGSIVSLKYLWRAALCLETTTRELWENPGEYEVAVEAVNFWENTIGWSLMGFNVLC